MNASATVTQQIANSDSILEVAAPAELTLENLSMVGGGADGSNMY